ncbi:MAG: efflux RND transporter periplasmic adaptor subunit [Myxococcota bacterium]
MTGAARAIALLGALLLAACGGEEAANVVTATPVLAEPVVAVTVVDRIEAAGQLLAVEEASVAAEVSGRVTEVRVPEGAAVARGDVVLEIDRERRQLALDNETAMVAEAEAAIGEARREVGRIGQLHQRKAASQAQLDDAETALRRARSRLAAARAQHGLAARALRDASVAAPFDGLVARRYVSAGDFVAQGQKLYDLIALDPVEVEFHLTERDSGRVKLGDRVEVRVAPYPDQVFLAEVNVVSPRIDAQTRTLRVKALLDNADGRLRPGLFARADLGVAVRENVPMIAEDAVLQRSDGAVVFVVDGDARVERRNIRLGVFRDGRVEAAEGLRVGERVVVRGHARLVDGSPVDLRTVEGAPVVAGDAPPSAETTP